MIPATTDSKTRYGSGKERFLEPALVKFVESEFPQIGGPLVVKLFIEKILEKIDQISPLKERVKPGQMIWNALDINTRARHPKRKTKSIVLTIISENEVEQLESGKNMKELLPERIAEMCKEAYAQKTLLSMRDIGLILGQCGSEISKKRIAYEKKNETVLPHTGSLHDSGTATTHKMLICKKVKQDRKDPSIVARETNHSQKSVDNYLQGYERVKALKELNKSNMEISFLTGMSLHLISQYENLVKEFESPKSLSTGNHLTSHLA